MNTIAVIPARGGSKRIPRKNVRLFHGKPIIAYSIEAALDSELFNDVIVSTDDKDIASISKQYGASIPFLRSKEYSNDSVGVLAVVAQVLVQLEKFRKFPSAVCMIYATAPMLRPNDLVHSYEKFVSSSCSFVFSATEYVSPIYRAFNINSDGTASMLNPEYYNSRSQDLPPTFHDAAQFLWGSPEAIKNPNSILFSEISQPYVIPSYRVVDIDTPEDWIRAEILYKASLSFDNFNDEHRHSR